MQQKNKNEKQIVETQEISTQNTQNDLEKKECGDTGNLNPLLKNRGPNFKNLMGRQFGYLVVIDLYKVDRCSWWKCICLNCNRFEHFRTSELTSQGADSCGCKHAERISKSKKTHGLTKSGSYNSWNGMMYRCKNPKCDMYKYYGGRGIKICKRWEKFENFYEDMGERPPKLEIDRIDTNLSYSCGKCEECIKNSWKMNCRWVTEKVQAGNKNNNRHITINGETKLMREWCQTYNISNSLVLNRIKLGWGIIEAIITPSAKRRRNPAITYNGETKYLEEWAKITGFSRSNLYCRIFVRKWSIKKAFTERIGNNGRL